MNLLLDTHVALWAIADSPKLNATARTLIADKTNTVSISIASLWEIAIKHSLQRKGLEMPLSAADALREFGAAGYALLAVEPAHVCALESLPALHADPFDRMLVAQASSEPLRLLTHDPQVAAYSDTIIQV